jgi:uncharacterized damage-inducible protein DinB
MITSIADFDRLWTHESNATRALLGELTDASLAQAVSPGGRTLGRLAWHVTQSIQEMLGRVGLSAAGPGEHEPVPASADTIRRAYDEAAESAREQVRTNWRDEMLGLEDDMYGESWTRGFTLMVLVHHQIHHRGQMTVLMRQAGLRVPGIYGPAREEWATFGMPEPTI